MNSRQSLLIDYLREENRVLREQLGQNRLHFTDDQRQRLATKAKGLGRKVLVELGTIVTPDTLLAWHRRLIAGLNAAGRNFGVGALPSGADREEFAALAEHLSGTERRAVAAERAALERYRAIILARSICSIFTGRISGLAEFGLFVTSAENGASGLVPISTLPGDYYECDKTAHRLIGRRSGRIFRVGDEVPVRLVEADAIGGRLIFRIEEDVTAPTSRSSAGERVKVRSRLPARRQAGRH